MKTQATNKLAFQSNAVVELDLEVMNQVNGGATTFVCGECVVVTSRIKNGMAIN
ncbi:hypothetical protein [Flavobacterium supellecticarium]|uniref:hypothetical protein n=1 Tax=Flavobacterium supellecticarium TaxID=2565924 RepID=UPI001454D534|nr:hypothetical protein [Flavobacterium supellecticarium]